MATKVMMDLLVEEEWQETPDLRGTKVHRDNKEQRYVGTFCSGIKNSTTRLILRCMDAESLACV